MQDSQSPADTMGVKHIAFRLSNAVRSTASPPIPQAYKWATSYIATKERPILDMSQGVPGVPPPKVLLEAMGKYASDPKTCGYCLMTGEQKLRTALVKEMKAVYGKDTDIDAEDIALTTGCNMAFVTAVLSIAEAGDEAILPIPWYFNHEMSLQMLGVKTIPLQTYSKDNFLPSPELCEKLITRKTKAIILVSPNNPTGAIYPPSLIASFAKLAKAHNVALIMDETYRDFILDGVPHHLFSNSSSELAADWTWRKHFIHLFSFSKSYCVPGHRLGAIVAPAEVLDQVRTVLDNIQICPPRHVQLALASMMPELRPFIRDNAQALVHRHELFRSLLPKTWKIGSQGAYYAFVRHPFKGISATDVCRRMAMESGIVTLPAGFFAPRTPARQEVGGDEERWIRFSVANVDDERVRKVCERLGEIEDEYGWDVEAA